MQLCYIDYSKYLPQSELKFWWKNFNWPTFSFKLSVTDTHQLIDKTCKVMETLSPSVVTIFHLFYENLELDYLRKEAVIFK